MYLVGDKNGEEILLSSCEILFTKSELAEYIVALQNFQNEITQYLDDNEITKQSFTHIHYQDCIKTWKKGEPDIVVYVDMSK